MRFILKIFVADYFQLSEQVKNMSHVNQCALNACFFIPIYNLQTTDLLKCGIYLFPGQSSTSPLFMPLEMLS